MLDERRRHHLKAMGISPWRERGQAVEEPVEEAAEAAEAPLGWPELRQQVSECSLCPELVSSRTQSVFGAGDEQADWLIIGEAPGAEEDAQGEPFVGPSGQLLERMLRAVGKSRDEVYITNILKCRPANDRDPHVDEAEHCEAFLRRQIALVQPRLILALGGIAAHKLLKVDTPVGKLRGTPQQLDGIPLLVTYHPAYLLRKPSEKRKSWDDLKLALRLSEEGGQA